MTAPKRIVLEDTGERRMPRGQKGHRFILSEFALLRGFGYLPDAAGEVFVVPAVFPEPRPGLGEKSDGPDDGEIVDEQPEAFGPRMIDMLQFFQIFPS